MSQKSGCLIVSNDFFIENVGHTLTKNYNGTYWPLEGVGDFLSPHRQGISLIWGFSQYYSVQI